MFAPPTKPARVMSGMLLATDQQASVLCAHSRGQLAPRAYTAYGHQLAKGQGVGLLGFNGEQPASATGHYLLGNGYRAFNPVLMRFNTPDVSSPFGKGGVNVYAYCLGDPVNRSDPSGHVSGWAFIARNLARIVKTSRRPSFSAVDDLVSPGVARPTPRRPHHSDSSMAGTQPASQSTEGIDFIGYHGSTAQNSARLKAGLNPSHMDSSAGLSSGRGFYVAPTRQTAVDFAEVAASNTVDAQPRVYGVYARHFDARIPGRDYQFGTMGKGGLVLRNLNEMEIVLRERMYKTVTIRDQIRGRPKLPRASEAPF